jgi:hypothetical protein
MDIGYASHQFFQNRWSLIGRQLIRSWNYPRAGGQATVQPHLKISPTINSVRDVKLRVSVG